MNIECICPPKAGETRHPDGDRIEFRERLSLHDALTARQAVVWLKASDPDSDMGEVLATLSEQYALGGIESWTVVDASGKRVEPSKPAIREYLFSKPLIAMTVLDEAERRYSPEVVPPLLRMVETSSPPTPMNGSTSATNGSSPAPRRRSKRSSTSITQTDVTGTTSASPAGVSSS
jgi:hypothetical protein